MTGVIKKELLYAGPLGAMFYLSGNIFVDRNSAQHRDKMNMAVEKAFKNNIKLWIFPEGNWWTISM
jgi:1-acyl-sn-glycerol-3-phosphate acyltransferase